MRSKVTDAGNTTTQENSKLLKQILTEVKQLRDELDDGLEAIQADNTIIEYELVKLKEQSPVYMLSKAIRRVNLALGLRPN